MADVFGDLTQDMAKRSRAMIRLGCVNCQHKWRASMLCLTTWSKDDSKSCEYFKEVKR